MATKSSTPPTQLRLTDITIDLSLRVREVDDRTAEEYAENVEALPPVTVWRLEGKHVLIDGQHRYRAHQLAGVEHIRVLVLSGTLDEARLYLAQCDARVGLRRSRAAKRVAIRLALEASSDWSDRKIAAHTGTSHTLVAQVRVETASFGALRDAPPTDNAAEESVEPRLILPARRASSRNTGVCPSALPSGRGGNLATALVPASRAEDDIDARDLPADDPSVSLLGGSLDGPSVTDVMGQMERLLIGCHDDERRAAALHELADWISSALCELAEVERVVEEAEGIE